MEYYFIDPRDHQDRSEYSDELWKSIAENGGYVLTEKEFEESGDAEHLEMMVWRKI